MYTVVQSFATFTLSTVLASVFRALIPSAAHTSSKDHANMTPLWAGISASTAAFSSCVFTTSATQTSKKNPEQCLAQLQKFLDSKVVKGSIMNF
jgi:hypothetical protein